MDSIVNVNHTYTSRITRNDCPIIPVITAAGNIKWIKVRPDVDVSAWLVVEWEMGQGRRLGVKTVRLAQERVAEGAVLLREAYEAEKWPEGWKAYEEYLRKANTREVKGKEGMVTLQLGRPKLLKFPERLLPKAVFERREKLKEREKAKTFEAPDGLKHPDDAKRQEIDEQKALLRAQLDREAAKAAEPATVEPPKPIEPKKAK